MRIGELAARAGVTVKAARYYEASGVISPTRLSNGYRDFTERDVRLVQEVSALGRLGLRSELTARAGLRPLPTDARQIYEETRVHTPRDWWNYYWGMEPYTPFHPDRERRYATIFLRP